MSTPTPPAPPAPPAAPALVSPASITTGHQEIRIVSHSMLFYWWPVWAVGLLLALLTAIEGRRMVLVPADSKARRDLVVVVGADTENRPKTEVREAVVLPSGTHLLPEGTGEKLPEPTDPRLRMSATSSYGVVFATVLLLVIFITNVPLRGLWSVVVIVFITLLSVIFALAGWWDAILHAFSVLDIRINMGGYLFVSLILLVMWAVVTMVFDRQIYMTFTPGQFKVCLEVGGGETSYDTIGMVIQKQRDDLFRHWILGLGSGDVIVRTAGAQAHEFNMHNVLFVGKKLQMIEEMQRTRQEVRP